MKSGFIKILTSLFPDAYIQRTFNKFQKTFDNNLVDQEFKLLPYLVNKQSILLDIGANIGEYCFFFQQILQFKKIIAFEQKHQNLSLKENHYIHNFLFFPSDFSIELPNNSLKSTI